MDNKLVQLLVPGDFDIPDIISSFSPQENAYLLKIGSEALSEGRKSVTGLTHQEIYKKIKAETAEEIRKLEREVIIQREVALRVNEDVHKTKMEQLQKEIKSTEMYFERLLQEKEKQNLEIQKEIQRNQKQYEQALQEKEKYNQSMRDAVDHLKETSLLLQGKSNVKKGSDGEKQVSDFLEDAFRDFRGYELKDMHTQTGAGDFHILFEEFGVLVDAKNYKKSVPITQREKIKAD